MDKNAHKKSPRIITPSPDKFDTLQPIFSQNEFDKAIETKGYDVEVEKGLKCPCRIKNTNSANPKCLNCGGSGWLFIAKKKTVAVIQSMNRRTKFLNWSETDRGTIQVTVKGIDRVAFMDKVRVLEVEAIFSQDSEIFLTKDGKYISFMFYQPTRVEYCFLYKSVEEPLVLLEQGKDFNIEEDRLVFTNDIIPHLDEEMEAQITIRYHHNPTYHIIDINREIVKTFSYDDRFDEDKEIPVFGQEQVDQTKLKQLMPVNSVAKKAHYLFDSPNASGESLYDNTPETDG
jgi:hypothetical protein